MKYEVTFIGGINPPSFIDAWGVRFELNVPQAFDQLPSQKIATNPEFVVTEPKRKS